MICPGWRQDNPSDARFCVGCGARLALACGAHPDRDQHRHRDHATVLSDLLEGGVQEEVWELAIEPSRAEGMDLGVELFADAADLVLGDALNAQCLGEVVDRPRRDAVDVGLLHD